MTLSDKIKTVNNKIEQSKAQYDLDKKHSALSRKRFLFCHHKGLVNMNV